MVLEAAAARRRLTRTNFDEHVRIDVPPAVRALLDDPEKGLIVASAHIGNWEGRRARRRDDQAADGDLSAVQEPLPRPLAAAEPLG